MNNTYSLEKGITLILWSLFSCLNCLAQDVNYINSLNQKEVKSMDIKYLMDDDTEDSLFYRLNKFIREQELMPINESYNMLHYDFVNQESFNVDDDYGVYVFGEHSSHPSYYLFFKYKNGKIRILSWEELIDISVLLNELVQFYKKNNIEDEISKMKYLFGCTKFLNQNLEYPISNACLNYDWNCE